MNVYIIYTLVVLFNNFIKDRFNSEITSIIVNKKSVPIKEFIFSANYFLKNSLFDSEIRYFLENKKINNFEIQYKIGNTEKTINYDELLELFSDILE